MKEDLKAYIQCFAVSPFLCIFFLLLHISVFLSIIWLFSSFSPSFLATAFLHFTDRQLERTVEWMGKPGPCTYWAYITLLWWTVRSRFIEVRALDILYPWTKWLSIDWYFFFLQNAKNREIESKDAHKMKYPSHLVRRLILLWITKDSCNIWCLKYFTIKYL